MNILIVAATEAELQPLLDRLLIEGKKAGFFEYEWKSHVIMPLVTGIGAMMTAYAMARFKTSKHIDIAINCGLAGSYDLSTKIGQVFQVSSERFADLGAEDRDGSFISLSQLGLHSADEFPAKNGLLYPHKVEKIKIGIETATSITVNTTSGSEETISTRKSTFNADIESMEGAAFYYACAIQDFPCVQIRAISNHIIPRDKSTWNIPLALDNLTEVVFKVLESN
jgi:futalosine hydrolase